MGIAIAHLKVHHGAIMFARFSLKADLGELARRFECAGNWLELEQSYNVAPTLNVLIVKGEDKIRRGRFMTWGIIPHGARGPKIRARMINIHTEAVAKKPTFREVMSCWRYLVLADSSCERQRIDTPRGQCT